MADQSASRAGEMPRRVKPACPCARCQLDAQATPAHGSLQGVEAGCTCQECRLWSASFHRDLAIENGLLPMPRGYLDRTSQRLRRALAADRFGPEAEAEGDPQPTAGGGRGDAGGNLLRRLLWRR